MRVRQIAAASAGVAATFCLLPFAPTALAGKPASQPISGKIQASELQQVLKKRGAAELEGAKVVGDLSVGPASWRSFKARNTTFTGDVSLLAPYAYEVPSEEEASPPRPEVSIEEGVFNGRVELGGSFKTVGMYSSHFKDDVRLQLMSSDDLDLSYSTFDGSANLIAISISGLVNLAYAHFKGDVDLSGAKIGELNPKSVRADGPIVITWSQFGSSWIREFKDWARAEGLPGLLPPISPEEREVRLRQVEAELFFWRRNFKELGRDSDSREVNFEIIKLRRENEEFLDKTDISWWLAYALQPWNRFGTRPFRPLWGGALAILGFALLFTAFMPFQKKANAPAGAPQRPGRYFGLLYSIETFVPALKVTGAKDWDWEIKPNWRLASSFEQAVGVLFTAVAAYSIGAYLI